jgi:glycosyltransferase involved in cell wall biosynthesis
MKVAMIVRSTLFTDSGGDTTQVKGTAMALRQLGIEVDIILSTEKPDYASYDLLHLFNVIRPADLLLHIELSRKPYVVSTIFLDYSEYEQKARSGWMGLFSKILSANQQEYFKAVARRFIKGEKIVSPSYLWKGHRKSVRSILLGASKLLPNSRNEYIRMVEAFNVEKDYYVVPNAIDDSLFKPMHGKKDLKLVICVARIEGRKNQLNLIRALNGTDFRLLIIGSVSPNHQAYFEQCKREAAANVELLGRISDEELMQIYTKAHVHVLPSWFETTGLSSLEAAAMGCNLVITNKGDTTEYFGDNAFYCEPDDVMSIRRAVELAAIAPVNHTFGQKIIESYNWKRAAEETRKAYMEALSATTPKS